MKDLLVLGGGFVASACASEWFIGRKLQSALGRVLCLHVAAFIASLCFTETVGAAAAFVLWTGMFTAWFGIRSHVESSILLRMLHFLRDGHATRDEMLGRYDRHDGQAARIEELVRAGLIRRTSDGILPTRKGRFVARIAARLR